MTSIQISIGPRSTLTVPELRKNFSDASTIPPEKINILASAARNLTTNRQISFVSFSGIVTHNQPARPSSIIRFKGFNRKGNSDEKALYILACFCYTFFSMCN